jgi:probable F420-dependent oxidoreductase
MDGERMRFGVPLQTNPERMPDLAAYAEQAGCDSVWIPEHLIWPAQFAPSYPYSDSGRPPVPDDMPTYDPWVVLGAVAARTRTIRLGTSVYILPLRDPFVTARAVGSLDVVSGGRAILGAGIGWLAEEFEIVSLDFATRAARAEEVVTILRQLWSQPEVSFAGRFYSFPAVRFEPKPPQGGALPIQFGGESNAALARAARLGAGWIGFRHDPQTAGEFVRRLDQLREDHGSTASAFEVTVGAPWDLDEAMAEAYQRAGVDRLVLRPWRRGEDYRPGLDHLSRLIAATG